MSCSICSTYKYRAFFSLPAFLSTPTWKIVLKEPANETMSFRDQNSDVIKIRSKGS
jgi:hypothetical protein